MRSLTNRRYSNYNLSLNTKTDECWKLTNCLKINRWPRCKLLRNRTNLLYCHWILLPTDAYCIPIHIYEIIFLSLTCTTRFPLFPHRPWRTRSWLWPSTTRSSLSPSWLRTPTVCRSRPGSGRRSRSGRGCGTGSHRRRCWQLARERKTHLFIITLCFCFNYNCMSLIRNQASRQKLKSRLINP